MSTPIPASAFVYSRHGNPSEVLRLHRYNLPALTPENVHIRFLAAPINPSDINQVEGTYRVLPPFTTEFSSSEPAAAGGNEGVAEVVAVGEKVEGIRVGDWVVMAKPGFGTWRTHATTKQNDVLVIPKDGISIIQAATLGVNPCTAYRMLKDFANLEQGDFVIQNGANSGVGQAVIQIARARGIRTINIVRDRSDINELKSYLESIGATHVLTDDELGRPTTRKRVDEWRQGRDIKLALNCVGGKVAIEMARYLGEGGHHVTYGAMSRQPLTIPASLLIFGDIHFSGFWVTKWGQEHTPAERGEMLAELIELIRRGELREAQTTEMAWPREGEDGREIVDAISKVMDGFGGRKVVLRMP